MKRQKSWQWLLLLALVSLGLQSCLGIGDSPFQSKGNTGNGNQQININTSEQAAFEGKIYFTAGRNIYVLDGKKNLKQLTRGMDARDPAVSPDGKKVAFIRRFKNYSDLMLMNADGSNVRVLRSGKGEFVPNPAYGTTISTAIWYAQPSWHQDGKHLIFLSDLGKDIYAPGPHIDAFLLDLQVYQISIDNPGAKPQAIAFATYGDGGLRDPAFRPGNPNQLMYTNYKYDDTGTKQVIQLMLEDPNAIAKNPYKYRPGGNGYEIDPGVPLTPDTPDLANLEPTFSPDGKMIMYVRREGATMRSVYLMPVAEGVVGSPNNPSFDPNTPENLKNGLAPYHKSVKLLSKSLITLPSWSPDGKQIVYIDNTNNTFDLWLATLVKDAKTGAYSLKQDSLVQLTNVEGGIDGDARPIWAK